MDDSPEFAGNLDRKRQVSLALHKCIVQPWCWEENQIVPQGAEGWNQPLRPIMSLSALGRAMVLPQHKVAEKEVA